MKVFVSSACIRESDLTQNIEGLNTLGYPCVELTGGLSFDPHFKDKLEQLKSESSKEIQLHNYSPPPAEDFVLNLGALDMGTYDRSLSQVNKALDWTRELNLGKYAVHAAFYIPVVPSELGKLIRKRSLFNKDEVFNRFTNTLNNLYSSYEDILYVENNVVSSANYQEYGTNPFMLTCAEEYFALKKQIPRLKLLLDFAHLKVSCATLGLDFEDQAGQLTEMTDYLHISDNDGTADSNQGLTENSEMMSVLRNLDISEKTITLEVYSGTEELERTYQLIQRLR